MARCIRILLYPLLWLLGIDGQTTAKKQRAAFVMLVGEAWTSIGTNRMRALLAMLGIIIGVASVILMIAIGTGSQRKVEAAISSIGSNMLYITSGSPNQPGRKRSTKIQQFTLPEIQAISQLSAIELVAFTTYGKNLTLSSQAATDKVDVTGTIPDYFPLRNWQFSEGDSFNDEDIKAKKPTVVISASLASKFFPETDAMGQTLYIGDEKVAFLVVGVLKDKPAGLDGGNPNNTIFVPYTAFSAKLDSNASTSPLQIIFVQATSPLELDNLSEDITELLRSIRKIPDIESDNFIITNISSIMQATMAATKSFSILLGSIASISLLVGSIGIMNIMLVTVSERTREIGIRKAIGATEKQILIQFLLEAVIIATIGSMIGFVISIILGQAATTLFSVPVVYTVWSAIMALGIASCIGVISGLYPAYKAAKMQPIEALRTVGV